MDRFMLSQVGDAALRRDMVARVPRTRLEIALTVAEVAEFDSRKLYVPEGFPSMVEFCMSELGFTRQSALKTIRVGRAARRFPEIFEALAEGRLNRSAVILLAPVLTPENSAALIAAAARRSNDEIRELVAGYAPRLDVPLEVSARTPMQGSVSAQTPTCSMVSAQTPTPQVVSEPPARVQPLSPGRFETRFTMGQETREAMQRYEQLLGRRANSEDMDQALKRGLEALAQELEKRRYGATDRPRKQQKASKGRHIPAAVRREVRARDADRCTFVAESGRRCAARGRLQYDHVVPVARGGESTRDNLRLRCHAHNQYEAERMFGAGFMHEKRERGRAGARRQAAAAFTSPHLAATHGAAAVEAMPGSRAGSSPDPEHDVTPRLRQLGSRAEEATRAAAYVAGMEGASLEARVRAALRFLSPSVRRSGTGNGSMVAEAMREAHTTSAPR